MLVCVSCDAVNLNAREKFKLCICILVTKCIYLMAYPSSHIDIKMQQTSHSVSIGVWLIINYFLYLDLFAIMVKIYNFIYFNVIDFIDRSTK